MNTFQLLKLQDNMILHPEHLEDGQKKGKLDILDQTQKESEEEKDSILLKTSIKFLEQQVLKKTLELLSVMPESVQITKKKILKDKSSSSKKHTQKQKSSKILVQGLTGNDKVLEPFWNKSTLEMSNKLWLPTKTECVDLELNSLNGFSKKQIVNSWFSAKVMKSTTSLENSQMTYLQLLQSLLLKTMDSEQAITDKKEKKKQTDKVKKQKKKNPDKDNILDWFNEKVNPTEMKALKIQVYPNITQRKTIKQWLGVRRWIYNRCLYEIKVNKVKPVQKTLRNLVINNKNFQTENTWMLNYEYDLRDEALRDLLHNYKTNFAKLKSNKQKKKAVFNIQYKRKKDEQESISVLGKKWNQPKNFYSSIFKPQINKSVKSSVSIFKPLPKKSKTKASYNILEPLKQPLKQILKSSEKLPESLEHTSRLVKTKTNKYFLHLPMKLIQKDENQVKKIISLDPGVKAVLTGYDPSGFIFEFGRNDIGRISRLLHYKNKLTGRLSKQTKSNKKRRYKLSILRIYEKIWNLVEELHKKLATWLCENYTTILLPKLNFHKCKKTNRKTREKMSSLRHCAFFDRLLNKSREYPKCKVIQVNESYTSITCTNCGNLHKSLFNKDIYDCTKCKMSIGRDIGASRNIFMRFFTKELGFHN